MTIAAPKQHGSSPFALRDAFDAGFCMPVGKRRLSVRFTPKSKSVKPDFFTGDVSLFIDAEKVGEIKDIKMAGQYSALTGYGLLIGRNTGTPVSHSYEPPFTFTGTIEKVTVEVDGAPKGEVITRPKIAPDQRD